MVRIGASPYRLEKASQFEGGTAGDALRGVLLLVLFGCTFFAVMLSTIFRRSLSGRAVSALSCFGAGVFLSACLLDLLPDVMESFENAHLDVKFPLGGAAIGMGFLMVLSLEQLTLVLQERGLLSGYSLHHDDGSEEEAPSSLPAILLVLSLSLHAFFEGLSLSVMSDANKLLQIFAALLIHKTLIGLSLGIRLVAAQLSSLTVTICALLFSIQVLIGGFAGISLEHVLSGQLGIVVSASLQGIACGTFLFITTMEALPHELAPGNNRVTSLLCIFIGCCVIALFIVLFPDAA